jgi:hypothetical protein
MNSHAVVADGIRRSPGREPAQCGRSRQPSTSAALVASASAGPGPEIEPACGWHARIRAGGDNQPGSVVDRAHFDSLAEARRWTLESVLYWQARASDGWLVTGGITAGDQPDRAEHAARR